MPKRALVTGLAEDEAVDEPPDGTTTSTSKAMKKKIRLGSEAAAENRGQDTSAVAVQLPLPGEQETPC